MSKNVYLLVLEEIEIDPASRHRMNRIGPKNLSDSSLAHTTSSRLHIKFHENWSTTFWVILFRDKQTDKPTKWKHHLTSIDPSFGWGNNSLTHRRQCNVTVSLPCVVRWSCCAVQTSFGEFSLAAKQSCLLKLSYSLQCFIDDVK